MENAVCMTYAVFLSVILDRKSDCEENEKSIFIKKCIKNMPSRGNFAEPARLPQTWIILGTALQVMYRGMYLIKFLLQELVMSKVAVNGLKLLGPLIS